MREKVLIADCNTSRAGGRGGFSSDSHTAGRSTANLPSITRRGSVPFNPSHNPKDPRPARNTGAGSRHSGGTGYWMTKGEEEGSRVMLETSSAPRLVGAADLGVTHQGDNSISCRKASTYRAPLGGLRWAFTAVLFPSESIENNNPTAKHKSHCKTW